MTLDDLRETTKAGSWKSRAHLLLNGPRPHPEASESFGTYWIEGSHRIREQVANDKMLVRLLRHILPPYEGGTITLFRGESIERWEAGTFGLAWTSNVEVAKMFGGGLNSVPSGGVVLTGCFEPKAIITGPNAHSKYLGEEQYTIDPYLAANIVVVETFPLTSCLARAHEI